MHFKNIAELLNAFEEQHLDYLLKEEWKGWNLWQCLKKPLYYSIKHAEIVGNSKKATISSTGVRLYLLKSSLQYSLAFLSALIKKKGGAFIVTDAVNKLDKNEQGYDKDVFVDELIVSGAVKQYHYFESSDAFHFRARPCVKKHFNNDGRLLFTNLIKRRYLKNVVLQKKVKELSGRLIQFSKARDYELSISFQGTLNLACRFFAQNKWHLFLFRCLKPGKVIIVDGIPDGLTAAAKKLHIPVYEMQHGFIGFNKSEYIISAAFKFVKSKMPVTDYICVFGEFFKQLLLQNGFWDEKEIIVLGNYAINKRRELQSKTNNDKFEAIFTTQPTTFSHCKIFLSKLSHLSFIGKIIIKPHPLEPQSNVEWYRQFIQDHPRNFDLINRTDDTLQNLENKNLLISYHSTTILEAAALGYPAVSITTEQFPKGINDIFQQDFTDVIKPVSAPAELVSIIQQLNKDPAFAEEWSKRSYKLGKYFYAEDYLKKIRNVFAD